MVTLRIKDVIKKSCWPSYILGISCNFLTSLSYHKLLTCIFFNEIVFFNVPGKREEETEQDKTEKGKSESDVLF